MRGTHALWTPNIYERQNGYFTIEPAQLCQSQIAETQSPATQQVWNIGMWWCKPSQACYCNRPCSLPTSLLCSIIWTRVDLGLVLSDYPLMRYSKCVQDLLLPIVCPTRGGRSDTVATPNIKSPPRKHDKCLLRLHTIKTRENSWLHNESA